MTCPKAGVLTAMTALRCHGQPEVTAAFAGFLAGDAALYATGAVIDIDGGFLVW